MNRISRNAAIIVFLVIAFDQVLKTYIKTHFYEGQDYHVFGNWFILHFVENRGMAFSLEIPSTYGKLILSIFRLGAIGFIIYMIRSLIRDKYHSGLVYCGALILAGAIGNMIDSAFYGLIFSEPHMGHVAKFLPEGGGYAGFLKGNVVDMLYFPVLEGVFPGWVPFWGGQDYMFFRPVFNIADASITIGVAIIIVFHQVFFSQLPDSGETKSAKVSDQVADEIIEVKAD